LLVCGGLSLSTGGVLVKIVSADPWQISFYRGITFFLAILLVLSVQYKSSVFKKFAETGWKGLLIAVAMGIAFCCYVLAMSKTSVANVLFTLNTSPFFAAILGLIFIKEHVPKITWLAIFLAMLGTIIMISENENITQNIPGGLYALPAAISFGIMLVVIRSAPQIDMMPAMCMAALMSCIISAFVVKNFDIELFDLFICLGMGAFQVGLGFMLVTWGAKYVSAATAAIYLLLEPILGPVWSWIGIGEIPSTTTIIGGSIIMFAILGKIIFELKKNEN